jgi:hypothetical protein
MEVLVLVVVIEVVLLPERDIRRELGEGLGRARRHEGVSAWLAGVALEHPGQVVHAGFFEAKSLSVRLD